MTPVKFRGIKREIRVVGIDGVKFTSKKRQRSHVVAVVYRGSGWLDGVLRTTVRTNGLDVTDKIIKMIRRSSHYGQIRVLMLHGIIFAGSNVVDVQKLYEKLGKPVIVFMEKAPNLRNIRLRLRNIPLSKKRLSLIEKAGKPILMKSLKGDGAAYLQLCGIDVEDAAQVVRVSSISGEIPEPLRVASLIASALRNL